MNKRRMRMILSGAQSIDLPKQLKNGAPTIFDNMDSATGWTAGAGAVALNNSEFMEGSGSLKLTSNVNATAYIEKSVNVDMNNKYPTFWPYCYINSALNSVASVSIYLFTRTDYSQYFVSGITLPSTNAVWFNTRAYAWSAQGGAVWTDPIRVIRFRVVTNNQGSTETSWDYAAGGYPMKPAVMFTFDDGIDTQYTAALPILAAHKFTATAYITKNLIGGVGYMTAANLQELNSRGWAIANHSVTHTNFTTLTQAEIETEITGCQTYLDGLGLTKASLHVAYPYGGYDADTLAAMTATGAKTGRTVVDGTFFNELQQFQSPYIYPTILAGNALSLATAKLWVDQAVTRGQIASFLFHTLVSGAPQTANEWNISDFSALCDYIRDNNVQTINIDECYRLYAGDIRTSHK